MGKIRVLITDDSVVIRKLLGDCLAGDPEIEVVGTAANGQISLAKISQVNPDIITLDVEMPVMDGLQTLAAIRKTHPRLPVIMFSTLTERGGSATLDALLLGANDYVTKPANVGSVTAALERIREDLIPKIKGLCRRTAVPAPTPAPRPAAPERIPAGVRPEVVVIGVSTGGPNALAKLCPALAKNFPVPVLIVQHMPAMFTRLLAERIAAVSQMPAHEGLPGTLVKAGEVWVAPGGFHMEVARSPEGVRLRTQQEPPENSCRPAVDVLFRSVAQVYGPRTLAVILTGMGHDGLRGCEQIHAAGGQVIVQDEPSSTIWGMPGAVARAGLADKILPLDDLAAEINRRVGSFFSAQEKPRAISAPPLSPSVCLS